MVNVGDVALKLAGRDAGRVCVVVDVVDNNYVLIDGEVRRRKCNLAHLEFVGKNVKIKKGANGGDVRKLLVELGIPVREVKKGKPREKKEKPKRVRKVKKKKVEKVKEEKPKEKKK